MTQKITQVVVYFLIHNTVQKLFIHNGFGFVWSAFKRLDVVCDLLRAGLGTHRPGRSHTSSEKNRGVIEWEHTRNRSVLVFIKASEHTPVHRD